MLANRAVTAATMQPLLQGCFPQARGVPAIVPLAADASTRRYFRMQWQEPVSGLPASCVLMVCEPWNPTETPDFLAVGRHFQACGVRVPQVYGVAPAQGCMCLEDFGDCTLAARWQQGSAADRLLWGKRAIDQLVLLHTQGTQRYDPACPAFHLAFDVPKLLSELQFFRQHAVEGLWHRRLTDAERAAFDEACTPLCTILAAQPRYLCHRDYHGWNLMVHGDAIGVLDFQDARMGPQPYDLASLLVDRGTPQVLAQEVTHALLAYYLERLEAEAGRPINRRDFAELFAYVAMQRCLKAVGTFAYMSVVHQRQQYEPYIRPTLDYVTPLLRRYEMLQPLATLLDRYVPS